MEYREDIDDNVSFNGKVAPQLARGMDIGYDLVTPSDSLIAPLDQEGMGGAAGLRTSPTQ